MIIGCVKEIKNNEFRVGLTPLSAKDYIEHGHTVLLETNAGFGAGFTDEDYTRVGVTIKNSAEEVWQSVDMIIKVKEPLSSE